MSIKCDLRVLSTEVREKCAEELIVKQAETLYNKNPTTIYPYSVQDNGTVYFPFAYARLLGHRNSQVYQKTSIQFIGTLREEQLEVRTECITNLNKTGSCVLSMYPGFGKTAIAIELACKIKLKTLVIVNRVILVNQWVDSINKFCKDIRVCTSHTEVNDSYDIFVINAINVPKCNWDFIGLLIVDECHMIVTETLSKGLLNVFPKYVVGLSATPYRSDGMDKLIDFHFGTYKIIKSLNRPHTVYVINTGFVPVMKIARNGKPEWNSVVESQSSNTGRIDIITKIVEKFKQRKFLILCKRIEQANMIVDAIQEPTAKLFGSNQTYDKQCRIIVATAQKAGVGFDDSSIDALILASDIQEYFVQYLGRCMRRTDVNPIIFDLVDENHILRKHFNVRKQTYVAAGGIVKNLKIN